MTRQKKYYLIFLAIVLIALIVAGYPYIKCESDLGNGYHYVSGRADDLHIRKDGKIIIDSTMIDFDIFSEYIVGLRLPAKYFECDGGYSIRLSNKKDYFVLNTRNGEVLNFTTRDDFEKKLSELLIFSNISLDYTKFESVWRVFSKYYENENHSGCSSAEK